MAYDLFRHAIVRPKSRCWIWTGASIGGYGRATVGRRSRWVHHVSYEKYVGPIAAGLLVLHRCDVPLCCNPDHLFLGTQKENIADCILKGRRGKTGVSLPGTKNPAAKINDDDVRAIRASTLTLRELSERYGISKARLSLIRRGEAWTHLE